jgi:hypothetical protein
LSWGPGMDLMVKYVQKSLTERIEQNLQKSGREFGVPIPTLANFVAGSFLALLKWWLENKMINTPEQMDEIFRKLTIPGIKAGEIKSY